MELKQLRVGNIVSLGGKDTVLDIDGLHALYMLKEKDKTLFELGTNPIPLTDQILLELGSEKNEDIYTFSRFKLRWREEYKYWYILDSESLTYLNKIEFVHEWQNFVFVMDGKELTLKTE